MKTVTVKGIEIGDGQPKVCVPIVASEDKAILEMASRLNHSEADIIEWRVDCYSEVKNLQKTITLLQELRDVLREKPLIFTFRSIIEGGNAQLSNADYYALNCEAANYADIVDVEIIRDEATAAMLIAELKDKGAYVLGSNHDFSETPEVKEIVLRLCEMQDLGADIVKIAAMPNSPADVITMLTATEEMQSQYGIVPFVTMSMGALGKITRVAGETFGSAITFAALDGQASAPGQMSLDEVKSTLSMLHN